MMMFQIRLTLALFLWFLSFPAVSSDSLGMDAYFDAYSEFDQMLAETSMATPPGMPGVIEPKAALMIATLSDSERFLVKPDFRLEHLDVLMDMCGKANRATMSYLLFDLKSHVDVKADPVTVASQTARVMERNIYMFQNELESLQPFNIRCMARLIPLLTEFASNLKPEERTDIRRAGVQQTQNGAFSTICGVILIAGNESLTESYRMANLQAVADSSSQFATALPISERKKILALIISLQMVTPPFAKEHLAMISAAMSDADCTGLCNFSETLK
jgi:hypothetical protein